ncbi:GTPase IMAP family member 4 [Patella vulgata]|uniref:GTPase IMAP family member 4 n=1 Tax=Patella vulgata TaxID=6465 RepID=UPI00217F71D1|nr:GTPase IMAP family member 4 [Patella vulgata]XP_050412227.1 GTPase IMAP family member 4 [Patella vulgata]XP_050412228.1 GTPase IMAP family member 4 [Patella vulgata]XP_050412229.1 GTPase IMAP family member 4 [Patella vulgata]XP_050412230.1 GTPase IMAP family member 4 [Patella vulgata]
MATEEGTVGVGVEVKVEVEPQPENTDFEAWFCPECTFLNTEWKEICEICLAHKESSLLGLRVYEKQVLRIILLGKTGTGKSSVGNSISESQPFKSEISCQSITKQCQYYVADFHDIRLEIVDTPGLFDTETPQEESIKEIAKCIGLSAPGPHAFVLVLNINRFTKEEQQTVEALSQLFGDEFFYYVVVLFTGKDALIRDGKSLEEFITKVPDYLRKLLVKCKNRFTAIDNTGTQEKQKTGVNELLTLIQNMMKENKPKYYTNMFFKKAEEMIVEHEMHMAEKDKEGNKRHSSRIGIINGDSWFNKEDIIKMIRQIFIANRPFIVNMLARALLNKFNIF